MLSISLVPAGIVPTTLAADVEGDYATVTLDMPDGTTASRTYEVAKELEAAGHRVIERLSHGRPEDAPPLLTGVTVTIGQGPRLEGGGLNPEPTLNPQANIATIEFKLLTCAAKTGLHRSVRAGMARRGGGAALRARQSPSAARSSTWATRLRPCCRIPDPERLAQIANAVVNGLRGVEGVYDIRSDHTPGIPEIQLELRPEARTLGLTLEALAGQARAAFFGAEARPGAARPGRGPGLRAPARG